ncbi:MAG: isopenicillin N synthase family dioxygenase [Gammaproteobacteria bacterium]
MNNTPCRLPVIDIRPLIGPSKGRDRVAAQIGRACREQGFFYIIGHRVDGSLQQRLERLSREFFAQDIDKKLEISMALGGRAWRGYFPLGGELTSGQPDRKEGLYFGAELADDHPLVVAGTPMHGRNLFPAQIPLLRETVLDYMAAMTELGHRLMGGLALSLGLSPHYFADRYTQDPLILFRIFHYPAMTPSHAEQPHWGAGEHTDYGVLTILKQDDAGGLEVKSPFGWIAAPPIPGTFLCNIGDMLDRMTGGRYRSTPHRVQSPTQRDRLSFPFFLDPNFKAEVQPIERGRAVTDDKDERWDRISVHELSGTYGEYLLAKVSKVFPQLQRAVAGSSPGGEG